MVESLRVEEGEYGTRYLGCGADLARAGIVRPDQLPGEAGPRKKSAVYYDGQPASRGCKFPRDERYMEVKLVGRDRFSVWVPASESQRKLNAEAENQAGQMEAERQRAKDDLSLLPSSRDAYRTSSLRSVDSFLGAVLFFVEARDEHGYSFDFNTVQEVKAAAARLRSALHGGGVTFDATRHARTVSELRKRAGLPPEQPRLRLVSGVAVAANAG